MPKDVSGQRRHRLMQMPSISRGHLVDSLEGTLMKSLAPGTFLRERSGQLPNLSPVRALVAPRVQAGCSTENPVTGSNLVDMYCGNQVITSIQSMIRNFRQVNFMTNGDPRALSLVSGLYLPITMPCACSFDLGLSSHRAGLPIMAPRGLGCTAG